MFPMTYTEEDLDNITELGKRVAEFRAILKIVITNYIQE